MPWFTIERPHIGWQHPKNYDQKRKSVASLLLSLPIGLEVEPAQPRSGYYVCAGPCKFVYQLTRESVRFLKSREWLKRGLSLEHRPVVCGCMGIVSDE
jgi:hypothetical protein